MIAWAALPFELWNRRYTRDTTDRRAARAAITTLQPATVVTGGSRGIGLALAEVFARHGHTVVLVARNSSQLETATTELRKTISTRVDMFACDVSAEAAFDGITNNLRANGLYLDVLINSAGVGISGRFENADTGTLQAMLDVNVAALARFTQRALHDMLARQTGSILNVASLGGVVPGPHQAAYYASKAFVLSLTEALAWEARGCGVRIAALAPGPVDTSFHAAMKAESAAYRKVLPVLSADTVAARTYFWFMIGQRVIVPGLLYRTIYGVLRVLPHPISSAVTGWLLKNPAQ